MKANFEEQTPGEATRPDQQRREQNEQNAPPREENQPWGTEPRKPDWNSAGKDPDNDLANGPEPPLVDDTTLDDSALVDNSNEDGRDLSSENEDQRYNEGSAPRQRDRNTDYNDSYDDPDNNAEPSPLDDDVSDDDMEEDDPDFSRDEI